MWCQGCVMLHCTGMNLIWGEMGYMLDSQSSHNMLLRRTITRTQHLVEGGTQLLLFPSLSKTAALILFSLPFFFFSDAVTSQFPVRQSQGVPTQRTQISFSPVRTLDILWISNCSLGVVTSNLSREPPSEDCASLDYQNLCSRKAFPCRLTQNTEILLCAQEPELGK